jgi:hypothetical protein
MDVPDARHICIDDDDAVSFRSSLRQPLPYDKHSELSAARAMAHLVWSKPRVTQRSGNHGEEIKSWN